MKNLVYVISSKFYLTAGLTRKLEHRVALLYPATKYFIIKKTQSYLIKMYLAALLLVAGLLMFAEISLYYGCLVAVIVYVMISQYINSAMGKQEMRLLELFEEFISEVYFNYQYNGMLKNAIEKAVEKVPYEMSVHGEVMLSYLKEAGPDKEEDYRDIAPNSLFLTFYSLSLTVLMYGDKTDGKGSVYLNNLGYLKENVNIELLKRKKLAGGFAGLSMVTILPVFSIKLIELWAVSNMPELREAYEGFWGTIMTIVLSLMTAGIYKIITMLKNPYHEREYRSAWAGRLLEYATVNRGVMFLIRKRYKASEKLNNLLKSVVYPYNIREFMVRRIVFGMLTFAVTLAVGISIGAVFVISLFVAAVAAAFAYLLMYAKIVIKKQILIMDSEEEIVRYQSVILMLMHMDRITVEQILNRIQDFAVIFKEEIGSIADGLSYMGIRAFERAKENIGFVPFEKLMDGFLATDMLGIERAFASMEEDRRFYVEKHKQENEEIIMKKTAGAKFLAFIPLCLIILIKLILPFVMEGMQQLSVTGL